MPNIPYISLYKPKIFGNFSQAKVAGFGLYKSAHFLQKTYIRNSEFVHIERVHILYLKEHMK